MYIRKRIIEMKCIQVLWSSLFCKIKLRYFLGFFFFGERKLYHFIQNSIVDTRRNMITIMNARKKSWPLDNLWATWLVWLLAKFTIEFENLQLITIWQNKINLPKFQESRLDIIENNFAIYLKDDFMDTHRANPHHRFI